MLHHPPLLRRTTRYVYPAHPVAFLKRQAVVMVTDAEELTVVVLTMVTPPIVDKEVARLHLIPLRNRTTMKLPSAVGEVSLWRKCVVLLKRRHHNLMQW